LEATVAKHLPARPDLDHLRRQAKKLLAKKKASERVTYRLADAQLEVAKHTGFANWPALAHHVQDLRALEGEWHFAQLEVDGQQVPASMFGASRILIDGDRFRSESPEATYEGVFIIDVEATPKRIDIEFVEGPEEGNWSYGIYELQGDRLTFCLGLVGSDRPPRFATTKGSGHALEHLTRASAARPANVTGGVKKPKSESTAALPVDPAAFNGPVTPLLKKLQGEWLAVELDRDAKPMPKEWLAYGSRTMDGNETKVIFGGQTMVHAKVKIDESVTPIAVDYLNLSGQAKGRVTLGIMDWIGGDVRFLMASAGQPRPTAFEPGPGLTLSRWTKK
jgi:uncharacterized protein (TIGR03067 family)